mgnify:FL=1
MPLKEIRVTGPERTYEDTQKFSRGKWAGMFGVKKHTFERAIRKVYLEYETSGDRRQGLMFSKVIPVSEFPRIVRGFRQLRTTSENGDNFTHPWAKGIDLSQGFEVTPPSGAKLIYEYEK